MNKIKIKEEASIIYQRTTHQGKVEINGESLEYRYSEDDNGMEFYIYTDNGWEEVDYSEGSYAILYAAIMECGNPEELGTTDSIIEISDETINDFI